MTTQEALNVIKPQEATKASIKKAYRQLALKFHPDINPTDGEYMKIVNLAFEVLMNNIQEINLDEINPEEPSVLDSIIKVFENIKHFPGIKAEVCGNWLWVSGNTYKYRKELKEQGLLFAHRKKEWYWRPPQYRSKNRKEWSKDKIRTHYHSVNMQTEEFAEVAFG